MGENDLNWAGMWVLILLIFILFFAFCICSQVVCVSKTISTSDNNVVQSTRIQQINPRPPDLTLILTTRNETSDANPITPPPSYESAVSAPPLQLDNNTIPSYADATRGK